MIDDYPQEFSSELAPRPKKGRGAIGNPAGRFESQETTAIDDGWWRDDEDDTAGGPKLRTTVTAEKSLSVITRNTSPDVPFDRSINPYRGCEHGCIYCFARPSHGYLNLSPGLDFETKLFYKPDAAALLAGELRKPGYTARPIALGVNTDAYQPIEDGLKVTRSILKVLADFSHPVSIITKSARILRDLDILVPMAERNLVQVMVSVTTLDGSLARRMEPRAAAPSRRIKTIRALSEAGVPVGVLASPMIPGLNDAELEAILEAVADAGATQAGYILLRLPHELKELFSEWLNIHYPGRAKHVLSLIRQCRAGKLNETGFGDRMVGKGPYAEMLRQRFRRAIKRLGLNQRRLDLDSSQFERPLQTGDQLALF